jgi:hypothetical protein
MHKIPLTPIEEAGLRAHGLDIGKPSQLSDVFRQGVAWGQKADREPREWQPIETANKLSEYPENVILYDGETEEIYIGYHSVLDGEWKTKSGIYLYPTHWMQLPEPPEISTNSAEKNESQ